MGERRVVREGILDEFGVFLNSRTVRFERLLPGPIERVWGYLTEPELTADWFAEAEIEPREGGEVELRIVVEQVPERKLSGNVVHGTVMAYEPPRTLSYTWNDDNGSDALLTFELEPHGDGVLLSLTHGRQAEEFLALSAAGWHAFLDVLAARLGGELPEPFHAAVGRVSPIYEERARAVAGVVDLGEGSTGGVLEHNTAEHVVLRFERRLAHPIERVWAALTEPRELMTWWGEAEIELVEGGRFTVRWLNTDEHGKGAVMRATITRLEPPNLLETHGDTHGVLRWDLRPEGDGTVLTFSSTLELPEEYRTRVLAGWHYHLDALAEALEGRSVDLVHLPNDRWARIHERYAARPA